VIYEYTRAEEFIAARSRHPMRVKMKTGVKKDGTITPMKCTPCPTRAQYGCHALTVTGNTGHKSMALYVGSGISQVAEYPFLCRCGLLPIRRQRVHSAVTACPQGYWPLERHMEKIARALNLDPIEFRLKNAIHAGEYHPFSTAWNEGREPRPEIIHTVGLEQCVQQARPPLIGIRNNGNEEWHATQNVKRKGIGVAMVMQGTAIPYLDMGGASIKMNDDGSFNLLVGATTSHRLGYRAGTNGRGSIGRAAGRYPVLFLGHRLYALR